MSVIPFLHFLLFRLDFVMNLLLILTLKDAEPVYLGQNGLRLTC